MMKPVLYRARDDKVLNEDFETAIQGWQVLSGEWHKITVDSNVDQSSGLDGNLAINSYGSYDGGITQKVVTLEDYSEIVFETYVQNDLMKTANALNFYIDGVLKLHMEGPWPWYRCEPIGIAPGTHELRFEYISNGDVKGKKAIIDSLHIWKAKPLNCLITKFTPPTPIRQQVVHQVVRGHSRIQQTGQEDTKITFTALFEADAYQDFMLNQDEIHYFKDEFGKVYRGLFEGEMPQQIIALNRMYLVTLTMRCQQKVGYGFV